MPNIVTFEDGSTVTYLYAADGTKLRTLHNINGATTQKDYCGSVIYENGAAKLWQTEAGYISMNDSKYHYYLQDHQGNNRVVINSSGTVQETNHYYPFGGVFASTGNVQPYKYNGKELDTSKGLNWYDYGARHYDAALGRWFGVDPLAEKYNSTSEYGYCLNNPVKYIDPYGKDVYGFDVNTGRLSIIEYNNDDFDKINLGVFDENNIFTITDKDNSLELFKGILLGKHFDDISKSGIVFLEGFLNEGIKMMKFLSFNSNIEFSAWAFHTDYGIGLSISPWILNETIINQDYIKMSSLDFYRNQEKVGYLGNKYFKIHTHPGSKNGLGGNGIPSDSDYKLMKGNEKYPHYILSKKDGIVQYFLNKTYKKTSIR